MALSIGELHAAVAPRRKIVPVPEWGGDVVLVTITAEDRLELRERLRNLVKDCPRDGKGAIVVGTEYDKKEALSIDLSLLALTLADETGARAFTAEQLAAMNTYPHDLVLSRLAGEAYELNGFRSDAVEAAAKKSDASQSST